MNTMNVKFYFNRSRGDLRSELTNALKECTSFKVVTGFVTEAGMSDFGYRPDIIKKLDLLVFGHANEKALQSMSGLYDDLEKTGKHDIIKIHLGYGHSVAEKDRLKQIYRPMMHSKVFLFHYSDGRFRAFVGSQNISGYSLRGLNSEAIVEIDGQIIEKIYEDLLSEIASIDEEAKTFRKEFLDIYEKLHTNMIKGMLPEENVEKRQYFSVLYAFIDIDDKDKIKLGETLYFEAPDYTARHTKIETYADVWIIPIDTEAGVHTSSKSEMLFFRARQTGANDTTGEVASYENVNWVIHDYENPVIKRHDGPSPKSGAGLQVLMRFERDFKQTYPGLAYTEIQYIPPSRQVFSLTPLYYKPEEFELRSFSNMPKITKGNEILEKNEWVLIDGFKEMSNNIYPDERSPPALLSPLEIKNHLDILKNGIFYRPKVRAING